MPEESRNKQEDCPADQKHHLGGESRDLGPGPIISHVTQLSPSPVWKRISLGSMPILSLGGKKRVRAANLAFIKSSCLLSPGGR